MQMYFHTIQNLNNFDISTRVPHLGRVLAFPTERQNVVSSFKVFWDLNQILESPFRISMWCNWQFNLSPFRSRRIGSFSSPYSVNSLPFLWIEVLACLVVNPSSVSVEIQVSFIETSFSYSNDSFFRNLEVSNYFMAR